MVNKAIELMIDDAWLEISNIMHGVIAPLKDVMTASDYHSVVEEMRLVNGEPWTIPITLEFSVSQLKDVLKTHTLHLTNQSHEPVDRGDSSRDIGILKLPSAQERIIESAL